MPTPDNSQNSQANEAAVSDDKITLLVGGKAHSDWSNYRIDSDFLKAADAWQLTLGLPDSVFPENVARGARVSVRVANDTVLSGRIDTVTRTVSRGAFSLALNGRDDAGILVDCAAPVFSAAQLALEEVIARIVRPLGITKIRIQAESSSRNDKASINPGERAWDALAKAAAGRGLWPWFEPDGTLVVGGPDYNAPPVATLVMNLSGEGNNLLSLEESSSIQGCYSELTILAQGHARTVTSTTGESVDIWDDESAGKTGQNDFKSVAGDPTIPYYRPQIIVVGDADSSEQLNYRAKKAMADARLSGLDLVAEVKGHRTPDGVLWVPGQRVRIKSEPHGIDGIYFLMGRTFSLSRQDGQRTSLRFKEDGIWLPDAYPRRKTRHKGGRKGKDDIAVVPVWEKR